MGIPAADSNSNLYRRPGPGLLLALAWPALKILSLLLSRRGNSGGSGPGAGKGLVIFQSYLVGDFYMALPAILALSRHMPVTVLGRPDCLFALEGTGVTAVGFECPYHTRSGVTAYWTAFRNALALRRRFSRRGPLSGFRMAVDFDGDPRTAFLLKAAGLGPVLSYARPYAWIFDRLLPVDPAIRHQSLKDDALASAILAERGIAPEAPAGDAPEPVRRDPAPGSLVLSCWTRKDTKNWPFEHWDGLLAFLHGQGRPLIMIVPPDGDADFQAFRSHWEGRIEFLAGGLQKVSAAVRACSGVIGTDNFLGHMAAHLGKPVLWINGSSESAHVAPRGPGTTVVQLDPMPCRPCRHRCINPVHKQCLVELRPEAAIAAAKTWLSKLEQAE